jgi:amino acid adenylation domain-containing protein/FkbH-like protein
MNLPLQITASFTAEPLGPPLVRWLQLTGIEATPRFSGFNQVFQEALDPASASSRNTGGCNLFLIRLTDLSANGDPSTAVPALAAAIRDLATRCPGQQLIFFCPEPSPEPGTSGQEQQLIDGWADLANVEAVSSGGWADSFGIRDLLDPESDLAGRIPYTGAMFAALAGVAVRRLNRRLRPPVKVLVLDADHTLWGGVCGEDEPGTLDLGGAFAELRALALSRRANGVLLGLCSKNAETDVERVFSHRAGALGLRREDFTGWKVNWSAKSQNLRELAAELRLGLDSFVFLDDNPAEIAEVRANCPEVQAFLLPEEPVERSTFLRHLWPLDVGRVTGEDRLRAEFYATESERRKVLHRSSSFQEFLRGLELKIEIRQSDADDGPRLAQLAKRTNQFNASGLQLTAAEFAGRIAEGSVCLTVHVRDRFGDYGLVGAVLYRLTPQAEMTIDLFLLSCRALGKGVERAMLLELAARARSAGAETLAFVFHETARNEPCRRFLEATGAVRTATGDFRIPTLEAGAISPIPEDPAPTDEGKTTSEKPAPGRPGLPSAIAVEIATQWWDAERFHAALEAQRRPRPDMGRPLISPGTETERRLSAIWCRGLGLEEVGIEDLFTDLGGTSIQLVALHAAIRKQFGPRLELADLFELPTVAAQAAALDGRPVRPAPRDLVPSVRGSSEDAAVAIIGMALRVPGAGDPEAFWNNLSRGVDSITRFAPGEPDAPDQADRPDYLPAKGILEDVDRFDAALFGILPNEARLIDPQHRLFLELAWEAMERAGHAPGVETSRVGVYAGASLNTYLLANLCADPRFRADFLASLHGGSLSTVLGNEKDFLATRAAYKLNLRGPALTIQTACSTSLVAVAEACRSLRSGLCDMALAGGVTITLPLRRGYFHTPDGILSADGCCRPFDAAASGTVFSNGGGVVLLKRLSDALRDGDHVHAVIRGLGLNNDGGVKHSYASPSVEGQAEVVRMAQRDAGIEPGSIGYVETNGTATPLGDLMEIRALTKAFRDGGATENGFCAIGSLKANIGHLEVASGVCGLIKAALVLEKGSLPPVAHFRDPNPRIDFPSTPFRINTNEIPWKQGRHGAPRRAAVSSFGVGGTNAHLILEEAPVRTVPPSPPGPRLFILSARSPAALDEMTTQLGRFATAPGTAAPADAAWTLATGRKTFPHRRAVVASDFPSLARALATGATCTGGVGRENPPVTFLIPAEETPSLELARCLFAAEPVFRRDLEATSELLRPQLGCELSDLLCPPRGIDPELAARRLSEPGLSRMTAFAVSHALANLLIHWGIRPSALIGWGPGEWVAATLSGMMDRQTALRFSPFPGHPHGADVIAPPVHGLSLVEPGIPVFSGSTGEPLTARGFPPSSSRPSHPENPAGLHQALALANSGRPDPILLAIGPGPCAGGPRSFALFAETAPPDRFHEQLIQTIGQLWVQGVPVDWATFHGGSSRSRVALPTYPFERQRHWVDAVPPETPQELPYENLMTPTPSSSRTPRINHAVREILSGLSGIPDHDLAGDAPLLELGFDSLLLAEVCRAIQVRFQTSITLRQMMSDLLTTDAMVAHLDTVLPPDALGPAPEEMPGEPTAPALPSTEVPPAPAFSLETVITRQLDLMRQQLDLLQNQPVQSASPRITPPAPAPVRKAVPAPSPVINRLFDEALTARQSAHVGDLIRAYLTKTRASRDLASGCHAWSHDPRCHRRWREINYPLTIVRANGARLVDADGNEYVDLHGGFGSPPLGHSPGFLRTALHAAIDRREPAMGAAPTGETSRLFCELTGHDRACFMKSASEALHRAARLARSITGRSLVVVLGSASVGIRTAGPDFLILPCATAESLETLRSRASELAAVILDPLHSHEFVARLRELTLSSGSLFIFDETVSGFSFGPGGAAEFHGIRPDLAVHGDALGGGLPLGVIAGQAEPISRIGEDESDPEDRPHPFALAAARAMLEHLRAQGADFWSGIRAKSDHLVQGANRIFQQGGAPLRLESFGALMCFRVTEGRESAGLFFFHLRHRGVHVLENRPCRLTAAHSAEEVEFILNAIHHAIIEMQKGGFLDSASELPPAPPVLCAPTSPDRVQPLSEPLAEIWLASQIGPHGSLCFNEIQCLTLSGSLAAGALERALRDLLERHEALRATFLSNGDGFTVRSASGFTLPLEDLSSLPAAEGASVFQRILDRERTTPFDLERGPLLRAVLLRRSPEEHVLLLNCHHLACDGWSYGVLLRELGELYNAHREGLTPALPPSASFSDFVDHSIRTQSASADDAFWLSAFAEPVAPLRLPVDFPPPAEPDPKCETVHRHLDRDQLIALKRCATASGATLFSLLLGTFQLLLHRISRESRFAIWFPAAGQPGAGPGRLVGHSVNVLPFIAPIDRSGDFSGHLRQIQARLLDSLEHQTTTYGRLVKTLGPDQRPLIEAVFNLERVEPNLPMEGLRASARPVERIFSIQPLHLKAFETGDGVELRCDFHTALYERPTIEAWMDTYLAMLESASARPSRPLTEVLSAVTTTQIRRIHDWNQTRTEYPRHQTIPGLFAQTVAAHPQAIALRGPGTSLTYAELDRLSQHVANHLLEAGIPPGARVALFLERSPALYAALLGVLKAGCVYVPIDPQYPAERIRFLVEDSSSLLVLTEQGLRDRLPREVKTFPVDQALAWSEAPRLAPPPTLAPENEAVLIYTSGSTGNPKGALLSHRGIIRLVCGTDYARFDASQRTMQMASICFDASIFEVFGSLLHGGRLVLPPPGPLSIDGVADQMRAEGVTHVILATALFEALADVRPDAFAGMQQVITGGDVASPSHFAKIHAAHPGCRLVNAYGPTENTTMTTHHPIVPEDLDRARIPIGRPGANCTAWIVDPNGQLAPPGIPGELWAGGDGVALGYWNRPDLTRARFVDHPFDPSSESKLYRTGDLCRHRPDGSIEFLGRIDQQVKIRGFRVEPEEVEVLLDRHPSVRQCKVAVLGEGAAGRFLAAYVCLHPGETTSVADFAEYLRSKLPAYMVPSAITILDALPITANGKIDTRSLAAPAFLPLPPEPQETGPVLSPTEQELAPLWNQALNLSGTDPEADFFASGGHSLLGMRLLSAVQKKLGVSLPLGKLFQASTLRLLAREIDDRRAASLPSGSVGGVPLRPDRTPVASGS